MGEAVGEKLKQIWTLRGKGDYNLSRALLREVHQHCSPDDHFLLGRIYHIYMQFECDQNDWEQALIWSTESVRHYQRSGSLDRLAHSLRHQADILRELGQYEFAKAQYEQSLSIYRIEFVERKIDLANGLRGYALLLESMGDFRISLATWREIITIYKSYQIEEGTSEAELKINELEAVL